MSNSSLIKLPQNWQNLSSLLSNWQREHISQINSEIGVRCLLDMWLNYTKTLLPGGLYCNATWDNIYCWPPTQAGTVISMPCSEAFQKVIPKDALFLEGNAIRICQNDGNWSQGVRTNYDECANSFEARQKLKASEQLTSASTAAVVAAVQHLLFFGSIISLFCLVTALAIFSWFRCLRCNRATVNIHLMIALVIRFVLLIVITEPYVLNRNSSYRDTNLLCKAVICMYLYGTVSSVSWMFIQGLYINTSLTTIAPAGVSTQKQFQLYYLIGWVLPGILLLAYIISMVFRTEQPWCWKGYAGTDEMWILTAPMFLALVLNLCFLLNITRIVFQQVRRSRALGESAQLKATVKATVILFFVLGVNNLLLLFNPGGEYENVFIILNTAFSSAQGIVVAFLYCFSKTEVHDAIRRWFNRFMANSNVLTSRSAIAHRPFSLCELMSQGVDRSVQGNLPEPV